MGLRGPKPHTWEICIEKIQDGSYLKEDTGCFIWTGRTAGQMGYGYMRCDGKDYYIHRLVYERLLGKQLPDIVRHSCDTPRCWNPEHLLGGNQVDNIQDAIAKSRAPQCMPASTRSRDRLTEIDSERIEW